jgi:hypothetical protein
MANPRGYHSHGSQGGKYARKQMLHLDYSAIGIYIEQLQRLEASVEGIVGEAMEKAAEKVQADTEKAVESSKLPAKGIYSKGDTEKSIIKDPKASVSGRYVEVPLGFDKTKPGAGGYLITGTPKMQPDKALERIYGSKKYEKDMNNAIKEELDKAVKEIMG